LIGLSTILDLCLEMVDRTKEVGTGLGTLVVAADMQEVDADVTEVK
jgi:hypothetical protein